MIWVVNLRSFAETLLTRRLKKGGDLQQDRSFGLGMRFFKPYMV
jgi:hypothetical protein